MNDWSARDLQKWEYQPLGPFLSKSFATSVSPWVVTLEALAPYRVPAYARPDGDPRPLPYLADEENEAQGGFDLQLEALLSTQAMRERGLAPFVAVSQQPPRPLLDPGADGDAPRVERLQPPGGGPDRERDGVGRRERRREAASSSGRGEGTEPLALPSGEERRFLEDGDEVILRGHCEREGFARIGFGECRGVVAGGG